MRKLLNTLYVTREEGYLSLDGENVVLTEAGKSLYGFRLPIWKAFFVSITRAAALR